MPTDFVVHSLNTPAIGVSYTVTPQNARALCWMIAHTPPSQRTQHTIAQLDVGSLLKFLQEAELVQLSVKDSSNREWNRITLIPGQPVLARFSGPHAVEIKAIFETDIIPTRFDSRIFQQFSSNTQQRSSAGLGAGSNMSSKAIDA
jgi:hypothetical protein